MASPPTIDYTSKDFDGFQKSMLDYASLVFPEWTSRSAGDPGVVLVQLMAYAADILSYYGDRIQQEAYLPTATQRLSLLQIAQLLGYVPHNAVPAKGTVTFTTDSSGPAVTIPAGTQLSTDYQQDLDAPVIFETDADVLVPATGGVVVANVTQGITYTLLQLGTSTGMPNQQLRIPNLPVIDGSVHLYVQGPWGNAEWANVAYLVDANPSDQVFTTITDADGSTWVMFGDDTNGAIPALGLSIYATYRVGGGVLGNVPAGAVANMVSDTVIGAGISFDAGGNPMSSAMSGGADPESNDQIRANAPLAWRTQGRAVTMQDFHDLALQVPGVTLAGAVANHSTSVTVYVTGPGGTAPSAVLQTNVLDSLASYTLAGVSLTVSAPTIVAVNFGTAGNPCLLTVKPKYSRAAVLGAVTTAIQNMLSLGNISLGMRVSLSQVYQIVQSIPGVDYIYIPVMARSDASQSGTADVVLRPNELPSPGTITLNASGGVG